MYYAFSIIGVSLGFFCFVFFGKIKWKRFYLITYFLTCLLFFFVISRLFGLLSYGLHLYSRESFSIFKSYRESGFIIWGAIIGFCLTAKLLKNRFALSTDDYSILSALFLTSFHWLAKLGCFHAGCCYGIISSSPLAIPPITAIGPNLARVPVQLIESCIVFVIWCTIICFSFRNRLRKHALPLYLFFYSIARFFLEFFRGDDTRGKLGGFYFSQWISIFIFALVVVVYIVDLIKNKYFSRS